MNNSGLSAELGLENVIYITNSYASARIVFIGF